MRRFAALITFCLAVPGSALAADPVSIQLDIIDCPDVQRSEVERVLATELGARFANRVARYPTLVFARCNGTRLVLQVNDPLSRKMLRRSFELGSAEAVARSRLVGIAASELVLASWAELDTHPVLRVEPEGKRPTQASTEAARERVRRRAPRAAKQLGNMDGVPARERPTFTPPRHWRKPPREQDPMLRLVAVMSVRRFTNYEGTLVGGGLRIGQEALVRTSWALDALYETGTIKSGTDAPRLDTWTLGGTLFLSGRTGAFTGRAGAGLRLGAVGSSASSDALIAPWGWPFLALSSTARAGNLAFDLSGEAGYTALPSQNPAATLRGVWLSAQLGIGATL